MPPGLQFAFGIVLTAVAGFVDAVGFIELGGLFASFMSGASISLGIKAAANEWMAAYHAAVLIAVFIIGATIASMISEAARPWGIPIVILMEAACLTAAVLMM